MIHRTHFMQNKSYLHERCVSLSANMETLLSVLTNSTRSGGTDDGDDDDDDDDDVMVMMMLI